MKTQQDTTLARDFFDIVEQKHTVIGCDLVVRDVDVTYRGPITNVRKTSSGQLIIEIDWRAMSRIGVEPRTWRLSQKDTPYFYDFTLSRTTMPKDADGTIHIMERHGLIAKILPAGTPNLEKPSS